MGGGKKKKAAFRARLEVGRLIELRITANGPGGRLFPNCFVTCCVVERALSLELLRDIIGRPNMPLDDHKDIVTVCPLDDQGLECNDLLDVSDFELIQPFGPMTSDCGRDCKPGDRVHVRESFETHHGAMYFVWSSGIVLYLTSADSVCVKLRDGNNCWSNSNDPSWYNRRDVRFGDVFSMYGRCKMAALVFYWIWRVVMRQSKDIGRLIAEKYIWTSRDRRCWRENAK
jgi:hypothetical protein